MLGLLDDKMMLCPLWKSLESNKKGQKVVAFPSRKGRQPDRGTNKWTNKVGCARKQANEQTNKQNSPFFTAKNLSVFKAYWHFNFSCARCKWCWHSLWPPSWRQLQGEAMGEAMRCRTAVDSLRTTYINDYKYRFCGHMYTCIWCICVHTGIL